MNLSNFRDNIINRIQTGLNKTVILLDNTKSKPNTNHLCDELHRVLTDPELPDNQKLQGMMYISSAMQRINHRK